MSLPSFPEKDNIPTRDNVVNMILASIAMEELGLSHIINAEGEKLQYALGTIKGVSGPEKPATIDDLLELNKSIHQTLNGAMMNQFFLKEKLQNALSASIMQGPTGPSGPQGPATIGVYPDVTKLKPDESPTVENVGPDDENVILKFGIPQGVTGAIGPIGVTGPKGDTGATGANGETPLVKGGTATSVDYDQPPTVTERAIAGGIALDFGIPKGVPGVPGPTPNISIGNVARVPYGLEPYVTKRGEPDDITLDFGVPAGPQGDPGPAGPQGDPGPAGPAAFKAYRVNLSSTSRPPLLIPLKDLTLEILSLGNNLDAYLIPSRSIRVDVRKVGQYNIGLEQLIIHDQIINSRTHIDNGIYNDMNEKWTAWIRQQGLDDLWTLHEVHMISSVNGARTSVWVYLIEEDVDYDNPNNPED